MGSLPDPKIRRIAIVGGGPAGCTIAKFVKAEEDGYFIAANNNSRFLLAEGCFKKIDIFEQQASIGGTWNYSDFPVSGVKHEDEIPSTNPVQSLEKPSWVNGHGKESGPIFTTPMYEGLESNLPKNLMCYSDKPFPSESQLFIPREEVCQYLEEYAEDVKPLIQFQTQVLDISLQSSKSNPDIWTVKYQTLRDRAERSAAYDAVAVCIGHYNVPYVPDIPGIRKWNEAHPGRLSHSRYYRRPEDFTGKKVIIVGNSASGVDIATQISTVAKTPVLVSSRSESFLVSTGTGKEEVPEIVEFLPPSDFVRGVRFKDGRIEEGVDAVLFCTGYLYSYPFLPSLHPKLISDGFRVRNVYRHMFYIEHPSLAFILLPFRITPFPMSEAEAGVIARVWSGRLQLPAPEAMYGWEDDRIINKGMGTSFHALSFPEDFDHHNSLYDWAAQTDKGLGRMAHRWNEKERWTRQRFAAIKKAFADRGELRHEICTIEELGFDYEAWLREEEEGKLTDPGVTL
ncbi:hypothetical protein MMC30_002893 [Trapelia coarctata]|nr:hypothetical protein [Trapelia coarctata]